MATLLWQVRKHTKNIKLANRILFLAAGILVVLAVWEKVANIAGLTLLRGVMQPARLLEHAALALLFVIALQLRDVRISLDKNGN
jgi:hypothetical protein